MNLNRRVVLKSMAASGLTCWATYPMHAVAAAARPLAGWSAYAPSLVVVTADTTGEDFLRGVIAAGGRRPHVMTVGRDLGLLLDFERRLRSRSTRVVGLLDDAAATLAVDMARSAGARLRWLRHHIAATSNVGQTEGWASRVGYLLASPASYVAAASRTPSPGTVLEGSFVSFWIES